MDINQLFVGTGAKISGKHQNGEFDAKVTDVTMVKNDNKKQYIKLSLDTRFGKAPEWKYFPVTDNDMIYAASNDEFKKRLINNIEFHKATMVKVGMASEQEVVGWTQEKLIQAYASLKGKYIRIKIEDDKRDVNYNRTLIIGPSSIKPAQNTPPQQPQYAPPAQQQPQQMNPQSDFSNILSGINNPAQQVPVFGLPSNGFDDIPF